MKLLGPGDTFLRRSCTGCLMYAFLLLLLPSAHRSQFSNGPPSTQSEALLSRGSASISLSSSLQLRPGSLLGFSFRSCSSSGRLLGAGAGESRVQLSLDAGQLRLEVSRGQNLSRSLGVGADLSDGAWHTVRVGVAVGGTRLCLSVDTDMECDPPRPGPSVLNTAEDESLVARLEDAAPLLSALSLPGLQVGSGLVGCIREGPGLRFTTGAITDQTGVTWGSCLLPDTCQGYNWASIGNPNIGDDSCDCENGGMCWPLVEAGTRCVCRPGHTGPRCGDPVTRCSEEPCRHGGNCTELGPGEGFRCECGGTGHSGEFCHIEDNSCAGQTCNSDGATCLDQPRSFLCDCAEGFTGRRCDQRLESRSAISDPCLPGFCLNGGSCVTGEAATCSCAPGYEGERCEVRAEAGCEAVQCPANTVCEVSGEGVACVCLPGYSGEPCLPTDLCGDSPCQNGGICSSGLTSFTCSCPPGYQGDTCQTDIAECEALPCMHGGTCSEPAPGDFTCTCAQGWEGPRCERDVDECEAGPCGDRGACSNTDGGFSCSCEPGWSGQLCDINIDECEPEPCQNGGTCRDLENNYECSCPAGFSGKACEVNINECESSPCNNGGNCVDGINSFSCECGSRFMGDTCDSAYDPCEPQPCDHGACVRLSEERTPGDDFSCSCEDGFNGTRCENNIDDCAAAECQAFEECFDEINKYRCDCPVGYGGADCSEDVDECASGPCEHDGECSNLVGRYECSCPQGWQGVNCELDIDECCPPDWEGGSCDGLDIPPEENVCNFGICRNRPGSFECWCKPGYTGQNCSTEYDECLSTPCRNNGTCENLVNDYKCDCQPGFEGRNCETNIDECEPKPCKNGATCNDGINSYTCVCSPGYTGQDCDVDIDDCASNPCENEGRCIDGVNLYTCDCTDTGFMGDNCEFDIDECLESPCLRNATCNNLKNDFSCDCPQGYEAKNCEEDVQDCAEEPCKNNAACFERSNETLYSPEVAAGLPAGIRENFLDGFSYDFAAGYLCDCPKGFEGENCETNIDECSGDPCQNGATCVDGIAQYTCVCHSGYEGVDCEIEIDECERFQPCQNGAQCRDKVADYECQCGKEFGGKNCSVLLTGCQTVNCLNGGTCTPWLVGESDHRANCSCTEGFDGDTCEIQTTFSFKGDSFITVQSDRQEGYELSFRFKTTLSNSVVAIGQSSSGSSFFTLKLHEGKLKVHSNMLEELKGEDIGDNLNNTEWQKISLEFNRELLIISLNSKYTTSIAINSEVSIGSSETAFNMTYIGGSPPGSQSRLLANTPNSPYEEFVGCIQDITVNGIKVTEAVSGEQGINQINTEPGCERTDQCNPRNEGNPCQNDGQCVDLWRTKKCVCRRPYLGQDCEYNYSGATFGYEDVVDSQAVVNIDSPNEYKSSVDLTMFIRTRKSTGLIFYLGKGELNATLKNYIIGRLANGALQVDINMNDNERRDPLKLYSAQLSDGNRHFIQITWMEQKIRIAVNNTIFINQELPTTTAFRFQAERLYLGNLNVPEPVTPAPPPTSTTTTTTTSSTTTTSTTTTTLATSSSTLSDSSFEPLVQTTEAVTEAETETPVSLNIAAEELLREDITTAISEPIISRSTRDISDDISGNDFFKGVIEDVRLGNGKTEKIVKFFELEYEADEASLGFVESTQIKNGTVSDDTCRDSPCENGAQCLITWNDFFCECDAGYKGEKCHELEYCYFNSCPDNSTCKTLSNGHECVSNLTLNGETTSLSYRPSLNESVEVKSLKMAFRTQSSGTLMQLVKPDGHDINFNVVGGRLEIVVRAGGNVIENFTFGHDLDDGSWHDVTISTIPAQDSILALFDNGDDEDFLTANSVFNNLDNYVKSSDIIIGSRRQQQSFSNHFRGCMGEVRIENILLNYFTDAELVNITTPQRFILQPGQGEDMTRGECVLCYQAECQNGGLCSQPAEEFECSCPLGYDGPLCAVNIDECVANMCGHGQCEDGVGNYTCACAQGWTGWLCDLDKDECEDEPCQHGGSCTQTIIPGNYTCACPPEYTGKDCEELKIKTCAQEPCSNGRCIPESNPGSSDQYRCDCDQGYTGTNCDQQINYCDHFKKNCQNGATCHSDFSSFSANCVCKPGFFGELCENDIDDCASGPCKNDGKCTDKVDDYLCDCTGTGFSGSQCQDNIDECLVSAPCQHGRCNDTLGDYQCICQDNFCGKNCTRRDPCQLDTGLCKNEGFCVPDCDTQEGFRCQCTAGWEGRSCNLKSSQTEELALIVGPIVGGMAFIALVGLAVFLVMARRKRKGEGHYRPAKQELTSPRLQLDNMLKIPPEERLI